jgi:hypothetical protein
MIATLILGCQLSILPVLGQSATATLSGTVLDQTGAVIPGANITVTNTATRLVRQSTTGNEGYFTVPLLPPGNYTVRVQRDGFVPVETKDVILNVNDYRSLEIHLRVSGASESVNVTGEVQLLQESPAVGTIVDRQLVENIPLNGRTFQTLIALAPGAVITAATVVDPGQFSVNGQRTDSNYFTVDGVSANISVTPGADLYGGASGSVPGFSSLGGMNNLVSVDALEEFKIQTSTYAPEFGRSPGAQIQIVTRGGTNRFRGTLFEYFRNDIFDANDWFANSLGIKKAATRQNDFGGVLGGPILLPGYNGRNRTFFFFSYEGLRLRQPRTGISAVPSLATRQAAAPGVRTVLNAFSLPNGPDLGGGVAQFASGFSDASTLNATSIRVDHMIGDKLTLFGRYNHAPSKSASRGGGGQTSLNNVVTTGMGTDTLTVGSTWVVSQKMANELRANYSKVVAGTDFIEDNFGGAAVPADSFFIPAPYTTHNAEAIISVLNATGFVVGNNATNTQKQINLVDNLSFITGRHSLKFGVDYRRMSPISSPRAYDSIVAFTSVPLMSLGLATLARFDSAQQAELMFTNFSAYAQDTWRLTPRLSLTYGLRWELNPAPTAKQGAEPYAVTNFNELTAMALAPRGTALWKTNYTDFAPRFGLAYRLSGFRGKETVIRGGGGIFYDLGTSAAGTLVGFGAFPYSGVNTLILVPFPLSPSITIAPSINSAPPVTAAISVFDPKLRLPRTYQWNLALEQSLGTNRSISASYVGALGRNLLRGQSVSNVNATFKGQVQLTDNGASSDYHALQVQFQQKLSRGLQALASYTWSHSIDTGSSNLGITNVIRFDPGLDRGPSDFDVRHSFNAAVTYQLPNPLHGSFTQPLLSDWAVDTIFTARSSLPVDLITASYVTSALQTIEGSFRPDVVPGQPLYLYGFQYPGGKAFNPAAFVAPPTSPLRQGTLGRNAMRGFSLNQINFAVRREFKLKEGLKLQFRGEFFNLFNHPNFANPQPTLSSPFFGKPTQMLGTSLGEVGGGLNSLYQLGGPRSVQFALKLVF